MITVIDICKFVKYKRVSFSSNNYAYTSISLLIMHLKESEYSSLLLTHINALSAIVLKVYFTINFLGFIHAIAHQNSFALLT